MVEGFGCGLKRRRGRQALVGERPSVSAGGQVPWVISTLACGQLEIETCRAWVCMNR